MEQRTKRNSIIYKLVQDFETNLAKGRVHFYNEERFVELVVYYESEGEVEKALEVTDLALQKFKYQIDLYLAKARLLLQSNLLDEAYEVLNQAETLAPTEIEVFILRSFIYCEGGQYEEALSCLDRFRNHASREQAVKLKLCEAYIHEHMKDFDYMFYSLKKVLDIDPENHEALEKMWVSVELSKKYEESVVLHKTLIDKNPYSYLAWYNLGHAYSCLGEYQEAIEALEYSFLINSDFELAFRDCAEICMQVMNYKKALSVLHESIANFGVEPEIMVSISECHIHLEEYDKAKKVLVKAAKQDPYNDEIFFLLGECFAREEKWQYAINAYRRALAIEDRREEYFASIATAYEQVGNLKKAAKNYRKAIDVAPEETQYWMEYAQFLMRTSQYKKAIEILDEAEMYAVGADLLYCKAACYYILNEKSEATSILEVALQDEFELHPLVFRFLPSLKQDKELEAMINYYEGELTKD